MQQYLLSAYYMLRIILGPVLQDDQGTFFLSWILYFRERKQIIFRKKSKQD